MMRIPPPNAPAALARCPGAHFTGPPMSNGAHGYFHAREGMCCCCKTTDDENVKANSNFSCVLYLIATPLTDASIDDGTPRKSVDSSEKWCHPQVARNISIVELDSDVITEEISILLVASSTRIFGIFSLKILHH